MVWENLKEIASCVRVMFIVKINLNKVFFMVKIWDNEIGESKGLITKSFNLFLTMLRMKDFFLSQSFLFFLCYNEHVSVSKLSTPSSDPRIQPIG